MDEKDFDGGIPLPAVEWRERSAPHTQVHKISAGVRVAAHRSHGKSPGLRQQRSASVTDTRWRRRSGARLRTGFCSTSFHSWDLPAMVGIAGSLDQLVA